jgi:hypothetical protein
MKKSKKNIKGGIGHSTNADCPPFITFIAVILTRLAYLSDCGFLLRYYEIFGTNGWMNITPTEKKNETKRSYDLYIL